MVRVEGVSDRVALYALAERHGRDLAAEGVSIGGAQAIGRFLDELGPRGRDVRLAGLCDAAEEADFRRGLDRAGFGSNLTRAARSDSVSTSASPTWRSPRCVAASMRVWSRLPPE
jgi:hypothetical protein